MGIAPGEVYWVQRHADGIAHPHVVIRVAGEIVTLCATTSNLGRVSLPGNVLLAAGEANLPRHSVIEVAKIITLDAVHLGAYLGRLSPQRLAQIEAGIRFIERSFLV